jgi:endonuclease-8
MPEGDTVFLTAHRLNDALAGKVLTRGEIRHPALSTVDLAGQGVVEVGSVGKHIFTRLGDGVSLHSHLRMDGSWHLYRPDERWRRPAHQIRAILSCTTWSCCRPPRSPGSSATLDRTCCTRHGTPRWPPKPSGG